jgi:hypothetical protein
MKQLYLLAMGWAGEQEADGLTQEEIMRRVQIVTDYLDYVWKHKAEKAIKKQSL